MVSGDNMRRHIFTWAMRIDPKDWISSNCLIIALTTDKESCDQCDYKAKWQRDHFMVSGDNIRSNIFTWTMRIDPKDWISSNCLIIALITDKESCDQCDYKARGQRDRSAECHPTVPESPAWKDGKLKCGDRWLSLSLSFSLSLSLDR